MFWKRALSSATVESFLQVLISRLTEYDRRISRREPEPDIYRLSRWIQAAEDVRDSVKGQLGRDDSQALLALQRAIKSVLPGELPPVKQVLKQMSDWEQKGRLPRLADDMKTVVARRFVDAGTKSRKEVKMAASTPTTIDEVFGHLQASERLGKEFPTPEALKDYMKKHPGADPAKHTVKGKPESAPKGEGKKEAPKKGPKDVSDQKGFEALKGVDPKKQQEIIRKTLLNLEVEKGEGKSKGDKKPPAKDVSKQEGFQALKGLSPEAQRKVIERALKMKSAGTINEAFAHLTASEGRATTIDEAYQHLVAAGRSTHHTKFEDDLEW